MKGSKSFLGMDSPEKGKEPVFVLYHLCIRHILPYICFSVDSVSVEVKKVGVKKIVVVTYMTLG